MKIYFTVLILCRKTFLPYFKHTA